MSVKRRLAAAGMSAAGMTAALALTGTPAGAAVDTSALAARPGILSTVGPLGDSAYGDEDDTAGDDQVGAGTDGRGNAGYGGVGPSTAPTPSASTPTGGTDAVPPTGGESPETPDGGAGPAGVPNGTGASNGTGAGDILPVTGASTGVLTTVGGLLTGAGAAACFGAWYTARRRRRA